MCINQINIVCLLLLLIVLTNCSVAARHSLQHKRYIIHVPLKIRSHHHTHTVYAHNMHSDHDNNNHNVKKTQNQQLSSIFLEQQQQKPSKQYFSSIYRDIPNYNSYEMWHDCLDMQNKKKFVSPYNGRSINDWRYYQQQLYSRNAQHHQAKTTMDASTEYIDDEEEAEKDGYADELIDEDDQNNDYDDDDDDDEIE